MVRVWAGRGAVRTQLACLETPQQFFIGATQPLLLIALLLNIHLQVGVFFRELPEEEKETKKGHKRGAFVPA